MGKVNSRLKKYKTEVDYLDKLSDAEKEWLEAYNQLEFYNNTKPLKALGVEVPKDQLKDIIHENKMERTDIFKLSSSFDEDLNLLIEVESSMTTIGDLKEQADLARKKNISNGVKNYYKKLKSKKK